MTWHPITHRDGYGRALWTGWRLLDGERIAATVEPRDDGACAWAAYTAEGYILGVGRAESRDAAMAAAGRAAGVAA